MGFWDNFKDYGKGVLDSATKGGLAGMDEQNNKLADQAANSVSGWLNKILGGIEAPTVETDANIKTDTSTFIFAGVILVGLYLIFGNKK